MSRRNVVDVTFLLFFSMNFQYQPIRCTDLIEVKNYFFSPFKWLCQVPAYLLRGSILKYTWTECKNRDPVFGFQVSRPPLERGEREREGCPIHTNRFQWNSNQSTGIPLVKCTSLRRLGFRLSGVHSTCPLVRLVRLVPMECHIFHWYSIGEMHLITETYNISVGFRLSGGAFYSSFGTIGTIGTSGITFIHWYSIGEMHLIMVT